MDIINDRYRIIKFIKQNRVSMSYIVQDLRRQYGVMQLNIINSERIPNSLINYYMKEFITLTNIESSKINKVYEFGVINLVDKKKFNDTKYYYTNEYLEHKYDLKYLIKELKGEKEVLDLFVEVCKSVNYLHLKGFAYGGVNLNNIWFNKNNHQFNIKLKDIATVKLERYNQWTKEDNNSLPKYFMSNKQEKTSMMYDIYSLGMLLFTICMENYEKNTNFNQILLSKVDIPLKIKADFPQTFGKKISEIIIKCTESNIENGYKNIYEIIKDINYKFNKNYESQDIEEINKINFNLKLIGREQEVNKVLEEYDSILENSYEDKIVLIHGESGIGKTKLLKTIKDLLTYKKANVYFNFSSNNKSNQLFKEIFKQIIRQCDRYLLDKYEKEIVNIIREVSLNKEINTCNQRYSDNEKLKTLNRVQRFMNELTKYQPIVLIIDDIYLADELSIELLEYLCNREVVNKSILLILSYSEGKHVLNKRILQLIENIKFRENVLNLSIKGLTEEQTGIMIQNILSMRKSPKNFSNKIYCKSYGNPLFIEEIIKDFFSKRIIYVDKNTACWCTDYNYNDFPIPTDINQLLLNQIDEINDFDHEILSTIATFINPISIETISYINVCCKDKIDKHIHSMLDRGLLCKKIGDRGFVYDFYNKLLKDMIYEDMDKNKKKEKHKLAANFLEKQFNNGYEEYIEELIYHLEKSEQNNKVIDYCLENSSRMKKLHNNIEAIKNLKKAIESIKYNCGFKYKEIDLLIDIGNLYKELGDFKEALYYFKEAESKAEKLNQYQLQISCLNNIASIYFDKNNIDKTKNYLKQISLIIDKNKNIEQYFKFKILKARMYNIEKRYNEAYEICLKCIDMCEEGYEKYKAIFYNIVSNIYIATSQKRKQNIF
ncbi:AAA family ATPase [Haloimpatiens sp. FM7330]|uniref:AAA family ATPase n=1 Tax=Haloimpatiens sp. FM7330 TaxID=3298610 RepID=UPI003637F103